MRKYENCSFLPNSTNPFSGNLSHIFCNLHPGNYVVPGNLYLMNPGRQNRKVIRKIDQIQNFYFQNKSTLSIALVNLSSLLKQQKFFEQNNIKLDPDQDPDPNVVELKIWTLKKNVFPVFLNIAMSCT